jgi:hypothetical protein
MTATRLDAQGQEHPFTTGVLNQKENARVIAEVAPYAWLWSDRIFAHGFEFP